MTTEESTQRRGMVLIPAGEFIMGSNDEHDEKPRREVYLDDYYIDVHPVTVSQYREFCEETTRKMAEAPNWGWMEDHPIVNVTWHDASAYSAWAGKRLPTEAEWEKAARGTDGRKYPWGNTWNQSKCANSCLTATTSGLKSTKRVGSYPKGVSPYGVHDMSGNVWEWCADWYSYDYYKSAPACNPQGPPSG